MKFNKVEQTVRGIPFIKKRNARRLYDAIIDKRLYNCLELGFGHGVASCYIAAALDELGEGNLTTVDLIDAQDWQTPTIEDLLNKLNLARYVTIVRQKTGYNWFLHNEISKHSSLGYCQSQYDFCIIDGTKNWTIDGCAFFLVDKLLKVGGWILFDDYSWTYKDASRKRRSTDGISHKALSKSEFLTPHIKEIFHLLVMQHPNYANFEIQPQKDWAWAQKVEAPDQTLNLDTFQI